MCAASTASICGRKRISITCRRRRRRGGKLIAYYDQNQQIQGYASLYQTAQGIEVRECIYLNSVALFKLLNLALQLKPEIILNTTKDEHLEKIIQGVTWQDYGFTMARINDYDLFNRLYGSRGDFAEGGLCPQRQAAVYARIRMRQKYE